MSIKNIVLRNNNKIFPYFLIAPFIRLEKRIKMKNTSYSLIRLTSKTHPSPHRGTQSWTHASVYINSTLCFLFALHINKKCCSEVITVDLKRRYIKNVMHSIPPPPPPPLNNKTQLMEIFNKDRIEQSLVIKLKSN